MTSVTDLKERETALDPHRSFIVRAPAGSGKTELLIQRFLKLLSLVEFPEQILCMTFTRKAAGEMRDRILEALYNARNNPRPEDAHLATTWELASAALEQDRRQGWHLLDYPSRLRVQTIDSFCAWLVRHMPLASRLGGVLNPEEQSQPAYIEASRRLLSHAESSSALGEHVRRLMAHLDNDKLDFQNRIRQLLEKRDQWLLPFFEEVRVGPNSRDYLEKQLQEIILSCLREADQLFPEWVKQELPALAAHSAEQITGADPDAAHPLYGIREFPEPVIERLEQWKALTDLFLTSRGNLRKTVNARNGFPPSPDQNKTRKQAFLNILEKLNGEDDLIEVLRRIQNLPPPRFSDEEWDVLQSTLLVLEPLNRELRRVFQENQVTDFTEISLAALHALGEYDQDKNLRPTDLSLYLDFKIHHILVDEYQDTSFKQFDLLNRLTAGWQPGEPRSLFIVGDPMQSIYRFRDAQVDLFLRALNEGIGDLRLERLTLQTNFRSQKKILDWINPSFGQLFPKHENQDLGEIPYTPASAFHPEEALPGVVLHPLPSRDEAEEAVRVADLVQTLQKEHPGKDIAILVRAKRHLSAIVREFRERHLSYSAEDIDPLTRRWEILDLLALMRALRSPLDRISWLAVLRAPWCGLSLNDLHALCLNQPNRAVWDLLGTPEVVATLSEEGRQRVSRFRETVSPALEALPRARFRDLLEGLWIALGGPACIPASAQRDVEVFFDEVERVIASGAWHRLDRFEEELERLFAQPAAEETRLHLMTMHKAKGLEFDFVILPGMGRRPRPEPNRLVFWLPHGKSLLMAPLHETGTDASSLYRFIKDLDKQKDQYEALRLLYVACTRARTQLHLFGHVPEKNGEGNPDAGSALARLWPVLEQTWMEAQETSPPAGPPPAVSTAPVSLRRLPLDYQVPVPAPSLPTGRTLLLEDPEVTLYEWAGFRARCLGTVLHRALQHLAGVPENPGQAWDRASWAPRLRVALQAMGLYDQDLEQALEQGLRALENIFLDERGRWILAPHPEAKNEYPLTWVHEGRVEQRVLDRTFVYQGERWIIDYKTGIHEGADLERFFEAEKERYRPQLEIYGQVLALQGESRPVRKALYHPLYRKFLEME